VHWLQLSGWTATVNVARSITRPRQGTCRHHMQDMLCKHDMRYATEMMNECTSHKLCMLQQ
jgi:hypothetical protein